MWSTRVNMSTWSNCFRPNSLSCTTLIIRVVGQVWVTKLGEQLNQYEPFLKSAFFCSGFQLHAWIGVKVFRVSLCSWIITWIGLTVFSVSRKAAYSWCFALFMDRFSMAENGASVTEGNAEDFEMVVFVSTFVVNWCLI